MNPGTRTRGKIGEFVIPDTVASIADGAFCGCYNLTSVVIPHGVEEIGRQTFSSCYGLRTLTIPSSVSCISEHAFDNSWIALETVYVDAGDSARVAAMLNSAGVNTAKTVFVEVGSDVLPLLQDPTPDQVRAVLSLASDGMLAEEIVTGAEYAKFCDWASQVQNTKGAPLGAAGVMKAENAWQSYALDSTVLLEDALADDDLSIEGFAQMADRRFDVTVNVKNVEVGAKATKENLEKVVWIEGATALNEHSFSTNEVAVVSAKPEDGNVKFIAQPTNETAHAFFMRVKAQRK